MTVTFLDYVDDMFAYATGWLGWSPEAAQVATFPDIQLALDGKVEFLSATTPGSKRRPRRRGKPSKAQLKSRLRAAFGLTKPAATDEGDR